MSKFEPLEQNTPTFNEILKKIQNDLTRVQKVTHKISLFYIGCTGANLQSKHEPFEIYVQVQDETVKYFDVFRTIVDDVAQKYEANLSWCEGSDFVFVGCTAETNINKIIWLKHSQLDCYFKLRFESRNRNHRI